MPSANLNYKISILSICYRILYPCMSRIYIWAKYDSLLSEDNFVTPLFHAPPPWFFAHYLKNLQATHTWKFLNFPNFWLQIPLWIFFSTKIFLIFCHLPKKSSGNPYLKICDLTQYFFADTPMIFFKIWFFPLSQHFWDILVEIIFRYHKKYF